MYVKRSERSVRALVLNFTDHLNLWHLLLRLSILWGYLLLYLSILTSLFTTKEQSKGFTNSVFKKELHHQRIGCSLSAGVRSFSNIWLSCCFTWYADFVYKCRESACTFTTKNEKALEAHLRGHDGKVRFVCCIWARFDSHDLGEPVLGEHFFIFILVALEVWNQAAGGRAKT